MGWQRYAGAVSGSVLGFVAGDIPGAIAGGSFGYKRGKASEKSLPKNMSSYPTPSSSRLGKRKRTLSVSGLGNTKRARKTLFVGKSQRKSYLKAIGRFRNRKRPTRRRPVRKRAPRQLIQSSAGYAGRTGKSQKNKMNKESYCLSQGALITLEQFGVVNDPDCAYIIHSSGNVTNITYAIQFALMRKIMGKAGFKISNQNTEVAVSLPVAGLAAPENSIGLRFVYTCKDQVQNTYRNYVYDTLDNQSFSDMVKGFFEMYDRIFNFILNVEILEPYKVAVYKRDQTSLTLDWILGAEMYLEDTKIEIMTMSTLKVQNRTLGALATANAEIDRVDAQPLKGYVYDFKNADPRVKHSATNAVSSTNSNVIFNDIGLDGLRLIRSAEFTGNVITIGSESISYGGSTEPLQPKYFANCTHSHSVLFQPGEIKSTAFQWEIKGKITNVIKKLRISHYNGTDVAYSGMIGKSQMIGLEELMRTISTNKVTLGYEREMKIGVVVKESKTNPVLETIVVSVEKNNQILP